ncbi:MAG: hypothetical protein AAGH53_02425 [Pseudomonadota bacterium]
MMSLDQPKKPGNTEKTPRKPVAAADPAFIASELQLALFRTDILHISDQMHARLYGFMDDILRSCSDIIYVADEAEAPSAVSKMVAREHLPDNDSLIASVFMDPASLLLLFCRAWEAELVQSWADASQCVAEYPKIWKSAENETAADYQPLINVQSRFLKNAEMMRLDSREFSAIQWRRIVLRLAKKMRSHNEGLDAALEEATRTLLANHDESQARLAQIAMFIDSRPSVAPNHASWREHGATIFLLELAAHLDIPYDALILASAMHNPALFALALRSGGIEAQDIVLIMGETPMAPFWFSSVAKAQQFAAMIAYHDPVAANKELSAWSDNDTIAGEPVFDRWPWTMT